MADRKRCVYSGSGLCPIEIAAESDKLLGSTKGMFDVGNELDGTLRDSNENKSEELPPDQGKCIIFKALESKPITDPCKNCWFKSN